MAKETALTPFEKRIIKALLAWKLYKVRPRKGNEQPANTDKEHCIYHAAHGDYTYSGEWVAKLVAAMKDPAEVAKIKAVKLA